MTIISPTFEWTSDAPAPCARRRRPTGAPPPLPHHLGTSGRLWLVAAGATAIWVVLMASTGWAQAATDAFDRTVGPWFAGWRTGWLVSGARTIDAAATGWPLSVVAFAVLLTAAVCRRWRHLVAYLASVLAVALIGSLLIDGFRRERPIGVDIVGEWSGYSFPSAAVAVTSLTVVGALYMLVPAGRARSLGKPVAIAVVGIVACSRLVLGVDHPADVLVGVVVGVTIPLLAFRRFTPNDVVPVAYGTGKTAHLDVGGARGRALRRAVEEQLGLTVLDVQPFGLAGSGGSTPLRLRVAGGPTPVLFGKLYAMNHVRADRWYKLARTILYGRLEDERPFDSVRRLVQHEDHALRLIRDAGLPTAAPVGIVELTPEREYLFVTELFDGATELGDAVVDDAIIDEGLMIVRRLWDAGLAHRDIKPANLLVHDGHLAVIDVAFAQVRPSPWRQAVDLANMMLVLAVRTDADRVYARALAFFTPDEIAEAFAAARGIASPTQLRTALKTDGRDLVARFRALAPERRPIPLQRWSVRRVGLAAGAALTGVVLVLGVFQMFTPVDLPMSGTPMCGRGDVLVLAAQALPAATGVPCLATLPAGWDARPVRVADGAVRLRLGTHRDGVGRVTLRLTPAETCGPPIDLVEPRPDGRAGLHAVRRAVVDGACTSWDITVPDADERATIEAAWSTTPRAVLLPGG